MREQDREISRAPPSPGPGTVHAIPKASTV